MAPQQALDPSAKRPPVALGVHKRCCHRIDAPWLGIADNPAQALLPGATSTLQAGPPAPSIVQCGQELLPFPRYRKTEQRVEATLEGICSVRPWLPACQRCDFFKRTGACHDHDQPEGLSAAGRPSELVRSEAIEHSTQRADVTRLSQRDRRDPGTAVWHEADQLLDLELAKRHSQRRPDDTQLPAQLTLENCSPP
jgi:hypothetical protein